MKDKLYEKTENAYILRQRKTTAIVVVVCVVCFGLIALVEWTIDKPQPLNIWIIAALLLAFVVIPVAVLRTECGYMVLVEKGIYFHRPLARTKFMAWEDVQDWGIAHHRTRYSIAYDLYFSKVTLKSTHHGRNKKIPTTYKNVIYIHIEPDDLSALQGTGIISFCYRYLSRNIKTEKKSVSMFTSDLVF